MSNKNTNVTDEKTKSEQDLLFHCSLGRIDYAVGTLKHLLNDLGVDIDPDKEEPLLQQILTIEDATRDINKIYVNDYPQYQY